MKPGPAVPLLGYALVIGTAATILAVWSSDPLPPALLGGSAALMAVIAAVVAVYARRAAGLAEGPAVVRPVPDYSFPIVAVALALCTMLVGAYLGLYLILIGGGILVLGLGGLAREARAERRALRRARATAGATAGSPEGARDAG
jgi:hypothetical protein